MRRLVNVDEPPDQSSEDGGMPAPRRFDTVQLVDNEIIGHFLEHAFLDPDDDRVLDAILRKEIAPGIRLETLVDREALRVQLREQQASQHVDYEPIPVSPQRRRQEARRRLAERSRSSAARLCSDLGVSPQARQLSTHAHRGSQPNLKTAIALVNDRVNEFLGIDAGQRGDLTADQAMAALDQLDALVDGLVDELRPFLKGSR